MGKSPASRRAAGLLRRRCALACALLALLTGACATGQGETKGPLLLHPLPPTAEHYAMVQGALVYSEAGLLVSVRPWDWRLVEEEFRRGGMKSPYGDRDGDASHFFFLRVRFENRSAVTLVFNPLGASLRSGEEPTPALETSDLYALAGDEPDLPARAAAFRRSTFEGLAQVRPGESLERYLVFPQPQGATQVVVALRDLYLGKRGFDLEFPFETFPGAVP